MFTLDAGWTDPFATLPVWLEEAKTSPPVVLTKGGQSGDIEVLIEIDAHHVAE